MLDDQALTDVKEARQLFYRQGASRELLDELHWTDFEFGVSDPDLHIMTTREWFAAIVERLDWRRGAFGVELPKAHVNLLEFKALRILVRRLVTEGWSNRRILVGLDSNVVIGAIAKGRSGSRRLRRLQQSCVAELLFHDLYLGGLPVASLDNPADDPSRRTPVRAPEKQPHGWADAYLGGLLSAVDVAIGPPERERWFRPLHAQAGSGLECDEWSLSHAEWAARRAASAAERAEQSARETQREKSDLLRAERAFRERIALAVDRRRDIGVLELGMIPGDDVADGDSARPPSVSQDSDCESRLSSGSWVTG